MKNLNYLKGQMGEKLAKEYLAKNGFQIVETNFRTNFGEIDIIAGKNKKLVFAEVKLKIGDQFGSPEEMANKQKIRRIQQVAEIFLQNKPRLASKYPQWQIDALCIVLNNDLSVKRITHWENVGNEMV